MSEEQKKKRAQAVLKSLLEGSEKLGGEDDYGRGLANFYRSSKLMNGRHLPRSKSSYFRAAAILCVSLVTIFFLLRLKDRNTQRDYFEAYVPIETSDTQAEAAEPAMGSRQDALDYIVFLIRAVRYKEALSAINEALEKTSLVPGTETELLSLYKMIVLYETGAEAKARALANSLRSTTSPAMQERLNFYSGLIQK